MEDPHHPNPPPQPESGLTMKLTPIETKAELAAAEAASTARNNELTTTLFGKFGYTEFDLLPLKAQYAIEEVVACRWDMEDKIARESADRAVTIPEPK